MERIMKLKQGETTNEDFVKMVAKELKVYEKHVGDFVWGKTQNRALRSRLAIDEYTKNNGVPPNLEDNAELNSMITKALKEEILAMAMMKRANKKRFGNLQISLKNSYLLGTNNYPKTVAVVLKILNNYKSEWTPPSATPTITGSSSAGNREAGNNRQSVSFLQANGNHQVTSYLRGTNDSFLPDQMSCLQAKRSLPKSLSSRRFIREYYRIRK
jgi:hypothetical protein